MVNGNPAYAPVALFAYRRPEHFASTVKSLQSNPEAASTHLTVFCDGAKRPEHADQVEAVRRLADRIDGFASVTVVRRERNFGLASNIIEGVTRLTSTHGRVIVLEDDLLLSSHFLRYMNEGLDTYADDERVASIHGYCYPVKDTMPETFFLRGADCWGWATWQRSWLGFEADGARLLADLQRQSLTRAFDMDGQFGFTKMLADQVAGRNDSWAVRWHASCFLANRLTLYPGRSLVHNIGNDASGTHCIDQDTYAQSVADRPVAVHRLPAEENLRARASFVKFFRDSKGRLIDRFANRVRTFLKALG